MDTDLERRLVALFLQHRHLRRGGLFLVTDIHTVSQGPDFVLRYVTRYNGDIGLPDLLGRMRYMIGKIAVVRQEQQTPRGAVQPSYGIDPRRYVRQQRQHRRPVLFVRRRGDIARRFVERIIDRLFGGVHRFSVHDDNVAFLHVVAGRFHNGSVDLHFACQGQLVRLSAGTDAGLGDVFIQTHRVSLRFRGTIIP